MNNKKLIRKPSIIFLIIWLLLSVITNIALVSSYVSGKLDDIYVFTYLHSINLLLTGILVIASVIKLDFLKFNFKEKLKSKVWFNVLINVIYVIFFFLFIAVIFATIYNSFHYYEKVTETNNVSNDPRYQNISQRYIYIEFSVEYWLFLVVLSLALIIKKSLNIKKTYKFVLPFYIQKNKNDSITLYTKTTQ
ncbi:hypothetical protein V2E24_00055 [Mycoplasmopsis ciconiae]|uniref:Transmembrane protein n=1 Tax=Mycoplasmopsis ciconiae TaxID=561067 RepID=A0ABU7MKA9_9BACT|nr:hypothetical protein [Mycoplasmopsis ciconiae]